MQAKLYIIYTIRWDIIYRPEKVNVRRGEKSDLQEE